MIKLIVSLVTTSSLGAEGANIQVLNTVIFDPSTFLSKFFIIVELNNLIKRARGREDERDSKCRYSRCRKLDVILFFFKSVVF